MSTLPLFGEPEPPGHKLGVALRELAAQQIFFGTSSWKYEGWLGQIYTPERYFVRGRFSAKRFAETCLEEYAATFPVVCGDFSFYQFPAAAYWERLFASAPAPLRFSFKVPEDVTVRTWPSHERYGPRAGLENEAFLNAEIFCSGFLDLLRPYRERIAPLILEFGSFPTRTFAGAEEFAAAIDPFLRALPRDFRYAVEIRNPDFLDPAYFDCLRAHGVAHVFNAWSRMPELGRQIRIPAAFTTDFTVVRALLTRGRSYAEAVARFTPYQAIREENPDARQAMRQIVERAKRERQPSYLFVNNRLEGNAPGTIEAVVD